MQRTLTVNSNHNSTAISNNQLITNEGFTTHTSAPSKGELNTDLLEEVLKAKLRTPKEAKHAIDTLNKNGFEGTASQFLTDDIIERAFKAFQYFKEAVERYDQDTTGYALNIQDLNKFVTSGLSNGYGDDEVEYHISRVVQLGFEKMNKSYIGFGYVIATRHGVHQEFK